LLDNPKVALKASLFLLPLRVGLLLVSFLHFLAISSHFKHVKRFFNVNERDKSLPYQSVLDFALWHCA
jgi:hypothetical protein